MAGMWQNHVVKSCVSDKSLKYWDVYFQKTQFTDTNSSGSVCTEPKTHWDEQLSSAVQNLHVLVFKPAAQNSRPLWVPVVLPLIWRKALTLTSRPVVLPPRPLWRHPQGQEITVLQGEEDKFICAAKSQRGAEKPDSQPRSAPLWVSTSCSFMYFLFEMVLSLYYSTIISPAKSRKLSI